jgi:hypothetical protein
MLKLTPINEEQLRQEAEDRVKKYRLQTQIIEDILVPVLVEFTGKKITRRIQTALKNRAKVMGMEYLSIGYTDDYSMYHIRIWGGENLPWDDSIYMLLGYKSHPYFDYTDFRNQFNTGYFKLDVEADIIERKIPNIPLMAAEFQQIVDIYEILRKEYGDTYPFTTHLRLNQKS